MRRPNVTSESDRLPIENWVKQTIVRDFARQDASEHVDEPRSNLFRRPTAPSDELCIRHPSPSKFTTAPSSATTRSTSPAHSTTAILAARAAVRCHKPDKRAQRAPSAGNEKSAGSVPIEKSGKSGKASSPLPITSDFGLVDRVLMADRLRNERKAREFDRAMHKKENKQHRKIEFAKKVTALLNGKSDAEGEKQMEKQENKEPPNHPKPAEANSVIRRRPVPVIPLLSLQPQLKIGPKPEPQPQEEAPVPAGAPDKEEQGNTLEVVTRGFLFGALLTCLFWLFAVLVWSKLFK